MSGFPPQFRSELKLAVDDCIGLSSDGDCSTGPHGPIGEWDVSRVNNMAFMFYNAKSFNSDLSKWDVTQVTDMNNMFAFASSFTQELCSTVWIHSKATKTAWFNGRKTDMFDGSSGSICKGLSLWSFGR